MISSSVFNIIYQNKLFMVMLLNFFNFRYCQLTTTANEDIVSFSLLFRRNTNSPVPDILLLN